MGQGTVNDRERLLAEDLDAHLTALQAGGKPPRARDLGPGEVAMLAKLHALARATEPPPRFVAQLGERLRSRARERSAGATARRRPETERAASVRAAQGRYAVNMRIISSLVGIAVLAAVILLALPSAGRFLQRATPPAEAVLLATQPPAPEETRPAEGPSATLTATAPPASAAETPSLTAQAPTPQPTTVPPTPAPTLRPTIGVVAVVKPSALPRLATLVGGMGGSGGRPASTRYVLKAELPSNPGQMAVYQVETPAAPDAAEAAALAKRLGMQPMLYEGPAVYDGARALTYDADGSSLHYRDARSSFYYLGHWYPADVLPTLEQITTTATSFLESGGLLGFSVQVLPPRFAGDAVQFVRTLDGRWPVYPAVASVEVGADGRVGDLTYRPASLHGAGDLPTISAQEAWQLAGAAQPGDRVWYRAYPSTHCNPRYWARSLRAGQRADLFGMPRVDLPLDKALNPRVTLDEMLLSGDLQPLVQQIQARREQDNPLWLHAWGQVQQAGEVLALQIEGWQALDAEPPTVMGVVRRGADGASLAGADGATYLLPDLPADIADGATVYVTGGEVQGRLEWALIQADPNTLGEPCVPGEPGSQPAQVLATVEKVDLIYYLPPSEAGGAAGGAAPRYAQPMWRFSGATDDGRSFEVWVQAVAESHLVMP